MSGGEQKGEEERKKDLDIFTGFVKNHLQSELTINTGLKSWGAYACMHTPVHAG